MKRIAFCLCLFLAAVLQAEDAPLRVLVHSNTPAYATELSTLLQQRGAQAATGAMDDAALAKADVLVLHSSEFKPLPADKCSAIDAFTRRGGNVVVLNGAIASGAADWWKPIAGAAWIPTSRSFTSRMMLYIAVGQHAIVRNAWSFDVDDNTYYDLDAQPNLTVLASAFTPKVTGLRDPAQAEARSKGGSRANVYDLQPQMWAYEAPAAGDKKSHRAFAILQGSETTLQHASYKSFVLRGIAWAGGRENVDSLLKKDEVEGLAYPEGGPSKPQDTVKKFDLHPEFTANLVASEPLITKPIAVQWDERGRLWVAESPEYPNGRRPNVAAPWKETGVLSPGQYERPARDRISILSDTDGDGVMDSKSIFYEGLELVTGFCFYKDGVLALHQPDVVFLRDTDNDGKADKVERVLTGFSPGDSHFVANHLINAPDGWIYVSMGGGEEIWTPDRKKSLGRVSSGIFRFKPDGSALEQVSSKGGNGFGADLTSDGELFFGQATSGSPMQHVVIPEWTLAKGKVGPQLFGANSVIAGRKVVRKQLPDRLPLMQIDVVGGYSAACASLFYEGGAWPAAWNNSGFVTEPILNVIHHEILKPEGASLKGDMVRPDAEFLLSNDYWFRPIDIATGADGALYISDFYSPVIAHSDTRGPQHSRAGASVRPDREHYFGRIYRVQNKEAQKNAIPDLSKAGAPECVAALKHSNRTVRANAYRLLTEKLDPAAVEAALLPLARDEAFTPARILALWGLQRLGKLTTDLHKSALTNPNASLRKSAALMAEVAGADAIQPELATAMKDTDARARIAALRALATVELKEAAANTLLDLYPTLEDNWTRSAAVAAASNSPASILGMALKREKLNGQEIFLAAVATRAADRQDAETFAKLVPLCAAAAPSSDAVKVLILEAAARLKTPPANAATLAASLRTLLASENPSVFTNALPLSATWDTAGELRTDVTRKSELALQRLADANIPDAERMQIVTALLGARTANPAILPAISTLLAGKASSALKRHTVQAIGLQSDAAVGALLIDAMPKLSGGEQEAATGVLLARPDFTMELLSAIEAKKVPITIFSPSNIFRLRTHPDKAVSARAVKLLDAIRKPSTDKDGLIAKLLPEVTRTGNATAGREVFTKNCAACHKFNDQGSEIGPILTGMGAHGPDNLLVHILDPNRAVDAGYEVWNVAMKDGSIQSGILAQENEAQMMLKTANGPVEIAKSNVKNARKTPLSLMPEGFEALGADALRDLLAYLCEGASQYRVLDLATAYTADTRRGLYHSADQTNDTLKFKKFGLVNGNGIPFNIADPAKTPLGGNLIILRSGGKETFAYTYPMQVEVNVGVPVKALNLLGGVAGWGAKEAREGSTLLILTMHFADGKKETVMMRDGIEFIDYVSDKDVPGSKRVDGIMRENQIRLIQVPVKSTAVLQKITLACPGNNGPAATIAAITAELAK